MIVTPDTRRSVATTVIPLDAVIVLTGALAALGSYLLPWYTAIDRPSVSITGLGRISDATYELHSGRLNWMIAAAALAGLVLGARRLTGRAVGSWRRFATAVAVLAVVGIAFDLCAAPEGMRPAHGLVFATVGAAVTAVGALAVRRTIAPRRPRRESDEYHTVS